MQYALLRVRWTPPQMYSVFFSFGLEASYKLKMHNKAVLYAQIYFEYIYITFFKNY